MNAVRQFGRCTYGSLRSSLQTPLAQAVLAIFLLILVAGYVGSFLPYVGQHFLTLYLHIMVLSTLMSFLDLGRRWWWYWIIATLVYETGLLVLCLWKLHALVGV